MITGKRFRNASAAIVAVLAVGGLTGAAVSAATAATAAPAIKARATMKVNVRGGALTFVNVAQTKSLGIGDEIVTTQPAYASSHSAKVIGHSYVTILFLTKSASRVDAELVLKHGSIEFSGINPDSGGTRPFKLAVVGGTGSYDNARGQATVVTGQGKSNPATFTISLLP
jgi:hypothetical protein